MSGLWAMLMRKTTPGRRTWPLGRGTSGTILDLPMVTVSNGSEWTKRVGRTEMMGIYVVWNSDVSRRVVVEAEGSRPANIPRSRYNVTQFSIRRWKPYPTPLHMLSGELYFVNTSED